MWIYHETTQGEAAFSDAVKSVLLEHWRCALSFPKASSLHSKHICKQGKGWSHDGQKALRLEATKGRYLMAGPPGQRSNLALIQQKKKKKILLHLWPPHLSKARKQNLPASPLPLPHRGPPLTKSEMVAYQRKAKLRIHKKVGSQVGEGP